MNQSLLSSALHAIPEQLRNPLLDEFEQALTEYRAGDWEKVGLKAGKFCEIAYTICKGHAEGKYPNSPSKPRNMVDDCNRLTQYNKLRGRSLCIQVPKLLIALYEIRNNRAISHTGSDVDPNQMDAELSLRVMKWIVAEFVRFYSKLSEEDSRTVVEAITVQTHRIIWREGDIRRILDPTKSAREKVLILAYTEQKQVPVRELASWCEYSNVSRLRSDLLKDLHNSAFIHFDRKLDTVQILPPGQAYVEQRRLMDADYNNAINGST